MLTEKLVWANVPVSDLDLATEFYEKKLGLKLISKNEWQAMLGGGASTGLSLNKMEAKPSEHTLSRRWKTGWERGSIRWQSLWLLNH